jgi:hypothetical protein
MTSAALGFMITVWSIIFISIAVTLRPLLKNQK